MRKHVGVVVGAARDERWHVRFSDLADTPFRAGQIDRTLLGRIVKIGCPCLQFE